MKINKTRSALALLIGMTAAAQAQRAIYITGSTAFRSQIFNAMTKDLNLTAVQGGTASANSFTVAGTIEDETTGSKLDLSQYPGLAGTAVVVYCNFSGSAEGVDALITPTAATYVSNSTSGTFSHTGVDIAFSDVLQAVTPAANETALEEVQTIADSNILPFTGMAVQPFTFIVNSNAAAIKNITQQNFSDLFNGSGNGELTMNFFNGVGTNTTVLRAVGRYPLSGTRITAILDDQYGLPASPLSQWALSANGTTTPGLLSTDSNPVPTTGNQWLAVTTNGYFSGGHVGQAIHYSSLNNAPPALAYISFADAQGSLTAADNEGPIDWNGQTPGSLSAWNISGVENGSYTFWGYEHMYVAPGDDNTFIDNTFGPGLITAIQYEITNSVPQTATVESLMNVYRNFDGGDVVALP